MRRRTLLTLGGATAAVAGLTTAGSFRGLVASPASAEGNFQVTHTAAEWRSMLTKAEYRVLREGGTEAPYSSDLLDEHRKGRFHCKGCNQALYSSATKFHSGTGWPSFYAAIDGAIGTKTDHKLLYTRTEAHCSRCGSHMGHIFNDGPEPTGKRHCIDGIALTFKPAKNA